MIGFEELNLIFIVTPIELMDDGRLDFKAIIDARFTQGTPYNMFQIKGRIPEEFCQHRDPGNSRVFSRHRASNRVRILGSMLPQSNVSASFEAH